MKVSEMLSIGSVVQLKNGTKKLMICGIKQTSVEDGKDYDYIGVMYPEGFIGGEYQFLFNHDDIEIVCFKGFEDDERNNFIKNLSSYYEEN